MRFTLTPYFTHRNRLELAARLLDAVLEAGARMQLHRPLSVGEEGRLKGARATVWDVLPEDRPLMLDAGDGTLRAVHGRVNACLDEMNARIPVLEAHEEVLAPRRGTAANAEGQL